MKTPQTWVLLLVIGTMVVGCATVPVTGRTQLNMVPDSSILSMSLQQYNEFLKTHTLSSDARSTALVRQVGMRIQRAVETYFQQQGMAAELQEYRWEFNLVESPEVNAWCMPGGKVVVYTGILPITQDEEGLAVVMGHEIAHAVAKHGNERMSQALAMQMGGVALSVAMANQSTRTRNLAMAAFGAGATVGILLPYSRLHESEADEMGLIFMAMAGYDPHASLGFWQRMAAQKSAKKKPPEFLSTHPSDSKRIEDIRRMIPKAMAYYRPGGLP
ncbi:MAG: M48 family metallopeptidase [Thermodesulfobacteriota bacterium]